jgi:tetratricopeptide (TPR) repeat protein
MAFYEIKSCFRDPNFALAVLGNLQLQGLVLPVFTPTAFDKDGLPATDDDLCLTGARSFYLSTLVSTQLLESLRTLTLDGSLEIYGLIYPQWSGEDGEFDVTDLDGIERLCNLECLHFVAMFSDELDLGPLAGVASLREFHGARTVCGENIHEQLPILQTALFGTKGAAGPVREPSERELQACRSLNASKDPAEREGLLGAIESDIDAGLLGDSSWTNLRWTLRNVASNDWRKDPENALRAVSLAQKIGRNVDSGQLLELHVLRAALLVRLARYEEALAEHDRAIVMAQEGADVSRIFSGILIRDHGVARLVNARGETYFHAGRLSEAIADYNKATLLHPELAAAYANRAEAELAMGDVSTARSSCSRAIKLDNSKFARQMMAKIETAMRRGTSIL